MKKRYFFLVFIVTVGVVYLSGPKPDTPVYSATLPTITASVEDYVSSLEARPDIKTDNQAEIVWINDSTKEKTEYVLLYLHGYTASKMEGEPVFTDFAKRYGCNVYAARLASQGIDTLEPMLGYTAERLWYSAKEALAIAEKLGHKTIIMSTSTGGTIALKLAAEFPDKIEALINLSPNVQPRPWNAPLLNGPWGLQIARFVLAGNYRVLEKRDTFYQKYWYEKYRIESLVQMQELVESTMTEETFAKVTCPTLNLYYYKNDSERDEVINVDKVIWMHALLGTSEENKRLLAIENAQAHVIGCGLYSQAIPEVENAIFSFTQEILKMNPIVN
jgi:pimeloyl-ACP methyl ester carboxylesterase